MAMADKKDPVSLESRFRGCLIGGAIGDALGAPVEFLSNEQITERFGPRGIREMAPAYGRLGAITDDTQMTLFTAEGLIRAWLRAREKGICHVPGVVHGAYLRWLRTQGEKPVCDEGQDGWLSALPSLNSLRAPGLTCLEALRNSRHLGEAAQNGSKGCGGVMRVAPVGLLYSDSSAAFRMAVELARLTHAIRRVS
jgi:ADP-ribosylglycohydrolase